MSAECGADRCACMKTTAYSAVKSSIYYFQALDINKYHKTSADGSSDPPVIPKPYHGMCSESKKSFSLKQASSTCRLHVLMLLVAVYGFVPQAGTRSNQ